KRRQGANSASTANVTRTFTINSDASFAPGATFLRAQPPRSNLLHATKTLPLAQCAFRGDRRRNRYLRTSARRAPERRLPGQGENQARVARGSNPRTFCGERFSRLPRGFRARETSSARKWCWRRLPSARGHAEFYVWARRGR